MRFSQPHDHGGSPCLRPIILDPRRSDPARPRRSAPTSRATAPARLPRHDHDSRRASGRRHPLVSWHGRRRGLDRCPVDGRDAEWARMPPSRCVRRSALAVTPPTTGRCPPRPPSAGPLPAWPTALAAVIGAWLADRDRPGDPASSIDGGRSRSTARRCGAPRRRRPAGPPARSDGPCHPCRALPRHVDGAPGSPGPVPRWATWTWLAPWSPPMRCTPTRRRRVPGHRQAGPLPVHGQGNQPTLLDRCARLAWHHVPVLDRPATAPTAGSSCAPSKPSPSTTSAFRSRTGIEVIRKTRDLGTRRWRTVVVYAITSPPMPGQPARLADLLRGHWTIENGLPRRDVTFAEDASQLRTGTAAGHGLPAHSPSAR